MRVTRLKRAGRAGLALLLVLLIGLFAACGAADGAPRTLAVTPAPLPAAEGLRIAVASDLHLNPDSRPSETPLASEFSLELVDALLWDAERQGADFLLLTGDIVNGGRLSRHAALTAKLAQAEAAGLPVYVVPGNHDLAPFTQTEFAAIYADFGYAEAASRDTASLSYSVKRDGLLLLMMDTAGYPAGGYDLPDSPGGDGSAFLSETTLRWAAEQLAAAREEGLRVLCAGHYNLLSPSSRDEASTGYYVQNGERFADLLREYGALLYLSGHIHTRAVYEEDGLRELVTEYLLSYPTAYSVLDLTDTALRYSPRRVDVDAWAAETGRTEPILLHYAAWQQGQLRLDATGNISYMSQRNPISEKQQAEAADFFYEVINAYWQGTLHERREALEAMPGCNAFFRCAEGYAYGWWLRELIDSAGEELGGFEMKKK